MKTKQLFFPVIAALMLTMATLACDAPFDAEDTTDQLGATKTMQALATIVASGGDRGADDGDGGNVDLSDDESAATATPTITTTPTPGAPVVQVSMDTNCRFGPGEPYEYLGALLVGEQAEVAGRLADESFWYIENPDPPPPYCWIWAAYAQVEGDTSEVPILTPPPLPLDFSVSLDSASWCAFWTVYLWVENTGTEVFESWQVSVTDHDVGENQTSHNDDFHNVALCVPGPLPDTLPPGTGHYVGGGGFIDDPTGHEVTATVRLCTEDGLGGDCVERSVRGVVP